MGLANIKFNLKYKFSWLFKPNLFDHLENKIDKEALMELTERALELLVPIIGDRMKLLAKLVKFQKEAKAGVASEEFDSAPVPTLLEERTLLCKETSTAPISVSKRYYMFF